ncbi:ATP-binding cassette domain-containing protein [Candidatus Peregrinibacteria bacterium]|nr:ATP-binding cassette domain-containing protein [Candidatus Peregrinibacteria bacterium]
MIIFDKVKKIYGQRAVLDEVSLSIEPSEFVSVIGPSGAGKSTLIYTLIGAEKINDGNIVVDDFKVNIMSEKALQMFRRKLGIIFQDYKLLAKKNVAENIAFALETCGFPKQNTKKRVEEVLKIVGLENHADKFPRQLSGGEQQKTAIARALAHDPKLIIADEPTGNLDPESAEEILDLLVTINKGGATVLLATHNKNLVNKLQKRVIRMEKGKIVSDLAHAGYYL